MIGLPQISVHDKISKISKHTAETMHMSFVIRIIFSVIIGIIRKLFNFFFQQTFYKCRFSAKANRTNEFWRYRVRSL